ncbi:flavin reductase family protein [Clostridium sp. UBA4548]|uniref:flavin reductase family protein n=1 Tax=Clostridium sp. UBA4548 TaxID=1946361 RepID=UPI0025C38BD8|nr:flavin reductase family protein [Clostridium sp. UBA4548]
MSAKFVENLELAMENLHKVGAFLTVKEGDRVNTMTISWGNIGFEWRRPIFTVLVRESRYTFDLIEKAESFTVSVPVNNNLRKELGFFGSKSGRDMDKFKECNLELAPSKAVKTPIIAGENMVHYECKIVYKQAMDPSLLSKSIQEECYDGGDYHTIYYGEIVESYRS